MDLVTFFWYAAPQVASATRVAPTARHACAQAPHTSHARTLHAHPAPRSWPCSAASSQEARSGVKNFYVMHHPARVV